MALNHYHDAQLRLAQAVHEVRLALPELQRQRNRENETRDDLKKQDEQFAAARIEAEEAAVRFEVLRGSVGARVEELQRKLADARLAVEAGEDTLKRAAEALRKAGEARAVALQQAESADDILRQRTETRAQTVGRLQEFAGTGLLSSALPHMELPDLASPPAGCRFHPRCPHRMEICTRVKPQLFEVGADRSVACHLYSPAESTDNVA